MPTTPQVNSAYTVLGLSSTATKDEVKEAFRRLVLQHHPDRAPAERRAASEATFREVKAAYETILRRQAGYTPPPPGSPPNAGAAEAYWHAHSADGRVPWGRFAGYETEYAFYRAMVMSGRNNMLVLSLFGLFAIPAFTALGMFVQGDPNGVWQAAKEHGLDALRATHTVNGRQTTSSPFAATAMWETQIVQQRAMAQRAAAAAAGGGAAASEGE